MLAGITACREEPDFRPKPRGYHRIELPEPRYVSLPDTLPYDFDYSAHAKVYRDSSFMAEPYWIEIYYPAFQANINVSFKRIKNKEAYFRDYVNDSHKLAAKHNIKAYSIEETALKTPRGLSGVVFELEGDVPSQFQFYVTDSTKNFLRASLYFPTSLKNDSLAPVIDYIKLDMMRMLNTVEWKGK